MTHPTVAHNRDHRDDLIWVKVGRSEYMRSDGVTIRKHPHIAAWWEVLLPTGEQPQMPQLTRPGEYFTAIPASAHALWYAKEIAELVSPTSPVYVPRGKV